MTKRVKELKKLDSEDYAEELDVLEQYIALEEAESQVEKKIKAVHAELEKKLLEKHGELTQDDVKSLVVDDKWMETVKAKARTELDDVSQALTGRVTELTERYFDPMPAIKQTILDLSQKVDAQSETSCYLRCSHCI